MKKIKCESQETYRNIKTNFKYESKEHADKDVADPTTDTKKEHIAVDVNIIVPKEVFSLVSKTKDEN
tara:strand:- start:2695 stop:2895 length:201 start_codon:yes stop_codon:yes gene_type:complete